MSQPDPTLVAFDDVVVDLAGRRLLRGGVEQTLEPKAFGVLALMVQAPGRVFSRDELMDAVWGHRHVTPGVLNRVMTLVRHALGEVAQDARYLHTLHGVGYRFDLPTPDVDAVPEPSIAGHAAVMAPVVEPAARNRLRWHKAVWLLPVLALVVAAGAWWRHADSSVRTSGANGTAPAPVPTLVVVPLKPIGGGDGVRTIADGLSEELIGSLARIDGLRVIARESTHLAVAESDDPARLAQRLGISHVLQGSLQQAGQSLRVHLRLVDANSGGTLWAKDFDRDASEVLLMQREIAESVAASLTLKLGLATTPGKSGDAEFLRRLLAARAMIYRVDLPIDQSTLAPEKQLRTLLDERPDDARTHEALALTLNFRAMLQPGSPEASPSRAQAVQEATIAQRLDPSLPDSYVVLAIAACARNDWEQCFAQFNEADIRGAQMPPAFSTATLMARLGYLDKAEAILREQLARDPLNGRKKFTLGRILDTLGRHVEARKQLFDPDTDGGPTMRPGYARWFNAYWRGDRVEALRIAEQDIGKADSENALSLMPGYLATSRTMGNPALWSQVPAAAATFERKTGLLNYVRLLAPDAPSHSAEFIRSLGEARERSYSTWDLLLWTKDLSYLRRDPAFQAYLKDNGILAYWKQHGFPSQCRPQGDGAFCE